MERHKEMERIERDRLVRQQQQLHQQREQQKCNAELPNAEQAVEEHFEESLRRAKEKVSSIIIV